MLPEIILVSVVLLVTAKLFWDERMESEFIRDAVQHIRNMPHYREAFTNRPMWCINYHFHRFKLLVCLLLAREKHHHWENKTEPMLFMYPYDYYTDYGTGQGWTSVDVGYGFFKNWYYECYDDGNL